MLPHLLPIPLFPFDVASTAGSTVAVFLYFVTAVVANVAVLAGSLSRAASSLMNTSANPGAGTRTRHTLFAVSHGTSSRCSEPLSRPSAPNWPPKVWLPQVMLNFSPTEGARRYLHRRVSSGRGRY